MKFLNIKKPVFYDVCLLKIILVLSLSFSNSVFAIIIRHDRADSAYQQFDEDYPQFFYLEERFGNKNCVATLIAERWAITAAHCVLDTPLKNIAETAPYTVRVGRQKHSIISVVLHPDFNSDYSTQEQGVDLALLQLDEPVGVMPISFEDVEVKPGDEVYFLGWGFTGLGTVGRTNNDGKFRKAYNTVSGINSLLEFKFSDPRNANSNAHDLEGIPGLGDSGGPALMDTGNGVSLIGVARGQLEGETSVQGLYGATAVYERITLHVEWIRSVLAEK